MIDLLKFRLRYGRQTVAFPDGPPKFPERFRGRPVVEPALCESGCAACADVCPTNAVTTVCGRGVRRVSRSVEQ